MVTVNFINFWDMTPCGLVDFNQHFGRMYVGHLESNATIFVVIHNLFY
jgi:hypothetical protein